MRETHRHVEQLSTLDHSYSDSHLSLEGVESCFGLGSLRLSSRHLGIPIRGSLGDGCSGTGFGTLNSEVELGFEIRLCHEGLSLQRNKRKGRKGESEEAYQVASPGVS